MAQPGGVLRERQHGARWRPPKKYSRCTRSHLQCLQNAGNLLALKMKPRYEPKATTLAVRLSQAEYRKLLQVSRVRGNGRLNLSATVRALILEEATR